MLSTNVNNFSEVKKSHTYLRAENKGYDTRKKIKDNRIRVIDVQRKALNGHAENLIEKLNYALKEANDAKLDQKREKDQVLNLQEHFGKKFLN